MLETSNIDDCSLHSNLGPGKGEAETETEIETEKLVCLQSVTVTFQP